FGVFDPVDAYKFTLTQAQGVKVDVTNLVNNAHVYLAFDRNNNGLFETFNSESLADGFNSGSAASISRQQLEAGTYFVWIEQAGATSVSAYDLAITPLAAVPPLTPGSDPGSNFNTALNLGPLGATPLVRRDMYG